MWCLTFIVMHFLPVMDFVTRRSNSNMSPSSLSTRAVSSYLIYAIQPLQVRQQLTVLVLEIHVNKHGARTKRKTLDGQSR